MKYAICNETFQGYDWSATCLTVAQLGYEGIEIAPFTLDPDGTAISAESRKAVRRTAEQNGLQIVGLHWLLVSPQGLSLTCDDPDVRTKTASYLAGLADLCADLGGRTLVLGSPAQRRLPTASSSERSRELAAQRLQEGLQPALARAAAHGLIICLEPLPPPEADFVVTLGEAAELIDRIGHPSLQTIFDVKSALSEGLPLPELIACFGPRIAHVHANDANRRGPGFGSTDFLPIFRALQSISYDGYISVEVFDYTPDPITIARDSLDYMRGRDRAARRAKGV